MTNGWKLIIRTQPGPQPPTPFIWGAIRLIILLESLQVRAPQPALCNCHSNRPAEVALRCTLQCYAVIVCARQSASDEEIKWKRWKKAKAVSQYELRWLKAVKSICLGTSALKGLFFLKTVSLRVLTWWTILVKRRASSIYKVICITLFKTTLQSAQQNIQKKKY